MNYSLVSDLILDVLTSKISVQQALSQFPKTNDDINIKCAFDALVHYEADEEYRLKVKDYAQAQDDYLEYIASTLKKGEKLPENIIKRYVKYHNDNLIPVNQKGVKSFVNYLKRMINF